MINELLFQLAWYSLVGVEHFHRAIETRDLPPAGFEEHEVLQTGSIHLAIFPPCQFFTIVQFMCI